jgi:hypothetical protein
MLKTEFLRAAGSFLLSLTARLSPAFAMDGIDAQAIPAVARTASRRLTTCKESTSKRESTVAHNNPSLFMRVGSNWYEYYAEYGYVEDCLYVVVSLMGKTTVGSTCSPDNDCVGLHLDSDDDDDVCVCLVSQTQETSLEKMRWRGTPNMCISQKE